jgi:hypothetical protein
MARSRRTPAMLIGRCSYELSGRKLQLKIEKSQTTSVADLSRRAVEGFAVSLTPHKFSGNPLFTPTGSRLGPILTHRPVHNRIQ